MATSNDYSKPSCSTNLQQESGKYEVFHGEDSSSSDDGTPLEVEKLNIVIDAPKSPSDQK